MIDELRALIGFEDNLGRKTAPMINASFLAWLDRDASGARPFFAFLNFYDAHRPYLPPAPFDARHRMCRQPIPIVPTGEQQSFVPGPLYVL